MKLGSFDVRIIDYDVARADLERREEAAGLARGSWNVLDAAEWKRQLSLGLRRKRAEREHDAKRSS